jgi:hypothetical protein
MTMSRDVVFPGDLDLEVMRMKYTNMNIHHIQVGVYKHMYMQKVNRCMGPGPRTRGCEGGRGAAHVHTLMDTQLYIVYVYAY